jgi:hypothetical protein
LDSAHILEVIFVQVNQQILVIQRVTVLVELQHLVHIHSVMNLQVFRVRNFFSLQVDSEDALGNLGVGSLDESLTDLLIEQGYEGQGRGLDEFESHVISNL